MPGSPDGQQVATTLEMVPVLDAVSIPFFAQFMDEGRLTPNEEMNPAADAMLCELVRYARSLSPLRDDR